MNKSPFLILIIATFLLSGCFVGIHGTDVTPTPSPSFRFLGTPVNTIMAEHISGTAETVSTIGRFGFGPGPNWLASTTLTITHASTHHTTIKLKRITLSVGSPDRLTLYSTDTFSNFNPNTIDWIKNEGLKFNDFSIQGSDLTLDLATGNTGNRYDLAPFWDWGGENGDHYKGFVTTENVPGEGALAVIYYTTFEARVKLTVDVTLAAGNTERVCVYYGSYPTNVGVDYTCLPGNEQVALLGLGSTNSFRNEFVTIFKVKGADGDLTTNPYGDGVYVCRLHEDGAAPPSTVVFDNYCNIDDGFVLDKDDWLLVPFNENSFIDPDGSIGISGHGPRFYGGSPLDWLSAAVWLFVPEDETDATGYSIGAFADGRNPSFLKAVTSLTVTAIYSGKSSGLFIDETATTFTNGKFDATFTLTADFGTSSQTGRVSGVISDIKKTTSAASTEVSYDGSIIFAAPGTDAEQNVIGSSSPQNAFFDGSALTDSSDQTEHDFTGKYEGGFFRGGYTDPGGVHIYEDTFNADGSITVTPNLVTGTFSVTGEVPGTSTSTSTLVGIFHGRKDSTTP